MTGWCNMIGIRADANNIVATGHIMRCITIAKQLQRLGQEVVFIIADEYPCEILKMQQMPYMILNSDWKHMNDELDSMKKVIVENDIKKVLVDSYQADTRYLKALGELCKVIYIDDLFEEIYPVDMIINYNGFADDFPYHEKYDLHTKLLLGPMYVPLREEFSKIKGQYYCNKQILLSSGGGDRFRAMLGILKASLHYDFFKEATFHVVIGGFLENKEELLEFSKQCKNIVVHEQITNMAELMSQCDMAISAAGTMLYELCAMQVPTVFFMAADNQRYDSDYFMKDERMIFTGDVRESREMCFKTICEETIRLLEDDNRRMLMRNKLHLVTDGDGAARIAKSIVLL